ncbi:MAG: hypothetical protein RIS92_233, partial [Verrucomicrobiota bacterium]
DGVWDGAEIESFLGTNVDPEGFWSEGAGARHGDGRRGAPGFGLEGNAGEVDECSGEGAGREEFHGSSERGFHGREAGAAAGVSRSGAGGIRTRNQAIMSRLL